MGTKPMSARFEKEKMAVIEERAKEEKTDKTTALRRIFERGAKQYRLEKAVKQYQEGKISIGRAAELAGISIWEMMDELKDRNIPNLLTSEDYLEGKANLEKALRRRKTPVAADRD